MLCYHLREFYLGPAFGKFLEKKKSVIFHHFAYSTSFSTGFSCTYGGKSLLFLLYKENFLENLTSFDPIVSNIVLQKSQ